MRIRNLVAAVTALAVGTAVFAKAGSQTKPATSAHVMAAPDEIRWQPIPPDWADGPPPPGYTLGHSEVAIIEGDPTKDGAPFVIRIRSTPGTQLPPHWHTINENITVLSGVFCVGTGDKLDEHACRDMPEGSYIVMPKGMHHFAIAKGDVVQVHGIGPFQIHWVK
jgi:quercetin dioxygenase-like cupin family protein